MQWGQELPQAAEVSRPVQATRVTLENDGIHVNPEPIAVALPQAVEWTQENYCKAIAATTCKIACMHACPLCVCCKVVWDVAEAMDADNHPVQYHANQNELTL